MWSIAEQRNRFEVAAHAWPLIIVLLHVDDGHSCGISDLSLKVLWSHDPDT